MVVVFVFDCRKGEKEVFCTSPEHMCNHLKLEGQHINSDKLDVTLSNPQAGKLLSLPQNLNHWFSSLVYNLFLQVLNAEL